MDEIVTWEKIRNIHRDEKSTQKLAKLPDDFFEKVQEYIEKKKLVSAESAGYEFENIKKIAEELVNIRLKKILTLSSYGVKMENLTPREKKFFDRISAVVKDFKSGIAATGPDPKKEMQQLKSEARPEGITLKPGKALIKILDDVPEFVGLDLKDYVLRAGDIVTIHSEVAALLVRKGKAEYVNIQ